VSTDRAVPVLVPAWRCRCARCNHRWVSVCDCGDGIGAPPGEIHERQCRPPARCPGCHAERWHLRALPREGRRTWARRSGPRKAKTAP
jgi:hypothetical protein